MYFLETLETSISQLVSLPPESQVLKFISNIFTGQTMTQKSNAKKPYPELALWAILWATVLSSTFLIIDQEMQTDLSLEIKKIFLNILCKRKVSI